MKIAIHQPEFLPWLGYFNKMARADKYVIFDHVQFKKRYFENRNRLKLHEEATWITIPVKTKGLQKQKILDVQLTEDASWQKKIFSKMSHCTSGTPYGKQTIEELEPLIFKKEYSNLIDVNLALIQWFRKKFGIQTELMFSSNLNVDTFSSSELILEICKRIDASTYLCGQSGKDYLTLDKFKKDNIDIEWQYFTHPTYNQPGSSFISHLSSLDFIFNYGPHSKDAFNHLILGEKHERN